MQYDGLFTSESVSEGHPDKLADQISDAIVDAVLTEEPTGRVACETLVADNLVVLAGEFRMRDQNVFERLRSNASEIARQVLLDAGYADAETGIDPRRCKVLVHFNRQSPHIAQGVDQTSGVTGAGDQGLMFGYACTETAELMPLPISLAHRLVRRQAELRRSGALEWLRPDAKSQVTVRYQRGRPVGVESVVLSTQHSPGVSQDAIRRAVIEQIIEPVIPQELRASNIQYLVNPTGAFEIGGPNGDTGVTGRKIIVDTYGGACPHGGGAFSGKDPSKVDRSGAYAARWVAKHIVAAGLARECTVQLAYAIGVVEPVSVLVNTGDTSGLSPEILVAAVRQTFDLTPRGIINGLLLERPIYRRTAAYGHFGREDDGFAWENTSHRGELVDAVQRLSAARQEVRKHSPVASR